MPTRAVLLAIFSVSCAAMVLSVAVPVVIVPNSIDDSLFDRPCNHQPCNSVAEGGHRMPLRYPALSEICRNAQLAGTWVFDLNGSHLSLIPPRFNGCPDGLNSFIAESPGVAKTCGGEARAFSDET